MGYYIEAPAVHGKAGYLVMTYGAERVTRPASFASIPEGKALVMVIDNGIFEAAGFIYSEREFEDVVSSDGRPREFLYMDRLTTELLSGYHRPNGSMPNYSVLDPASVKAAVARVKAEAKDGETVPETLKRLAEEDRQAAEPEQASPHSAKTGKVRGLFRKN